MTGPPGHASGARTRSQPTPVGAAGLWIDLAPNGSLVVAGQASRGFLDGLEPLG